MSDGNATGLIVVLKGETTLPWWAYITALVLGGVVTPFSTLLYARMGNGIATNQLMKMVAGAINPGKPVANLYVRTAITLSYSITLRRDAVLHVEPRRRLNFDRPCGRPEDGSIPEDSPSSNVLDTGLGNNSGSYCQLRYIYPSMSPNFGADEGPVAVMVSIVDAQRDILLDPRGTNVWVSRLCTQGYARHSRWDVYSRASIRKA